MTGFRLEPEEKRIGEHAFDGCTALTHLAFTAPVERIGDSAFAGCTALTKVEVQSVSYCGTDVFDGCIGLQRVFCCTPELTFPESVKVSSSLSDGDYVLVRYDFGDVGGGCTLFSDTVMSSSYIDSGGRTFDHWEDIDGNRVSDVSSLERSTELRAVWVQADGTEGTWPADAALCVLSAICAVTVCAVCLRRF